MHMHCSAHALQGRYLGRRAVTAESQPCTCSLQAILLLHALPAAAGPLLAKLHSNRAAARLMRHAPLEGLADCTAALQVNCHRLVDVSSREAMPTVHIVICPLFLIALIPPQGAPVPREVCLLFGYKLNIRLDTCLNPASAEISEFQNFMTCPALSWSSRNRRC